MISKYLLILIGIIILFCPSVIAITCNSSYSNYSESNADSFYQMMDLAEYTGQSFNSTYAATVYSVTFYLKRTGSPVGNLTAYLYNAQFNVLSGGFVPVLPLLATSNTINVTNISNAGYFLVTFNFSTPYTLAINSPYAVELRDSNAAGAPLNYIEVATDTTAPTHPGNRFEQLAGAWQAVPGEDTVFYLITDCSYVSDSWSNSKTSDKKLYVPVNKGETITFNLIYDTPSLVNNYWSLNGVNTTEVSYIYTHTFNEEHEVMYVRGSHNNLSVTWIIPVKSEKTIIPQATRDTAHYQNLSNATEAHDPSLFMETIVAENTDIFGNMFYVLIWGAIFGAFWIHKRSITLPSTLGLIFGALIISTLPADYQMIAQFMISAGVIIVLFLMFKERR